MFNKSKNNQVCQSQQMITDALLSLLQTFQYEDITITQICNEAQVVRRTFYRNFEFKGDILEYYIDNMFQQYISTYYDSKLNMQQDLKCYFDFLLQHKDFLILMDKHNFFYLFNKTYSKYISQFLYIPKIIDTVKEPKLEVYVLAFISSTICSNISLWVNNRFSTSSTIMASLTTVFLSGLKNATDFKTQ